MIEVRVMAISDRGSHAKLGLTRLVCFAYFDCPSPNGPTFRRQFGGGPVWELREPLAR